MMVGRDLKEIEPRPLKPGRSDWALRNCMPGDRQRGAGGVDLEIHAGELSVWPGIR